MNSAGHVRSSYPGNRIHTQYGKRNTHRTMAMAMRWRWRRRRRMQSSRRRQWQRRRQQTDAKVLRNFGLGSQLLLCPFCAPLVNVDLTVCSVENSALPLFLSLPLPAWKTPWVVPAPLLLRARTSRLQTAIEPSFCADVIVCPGRRS